MLTEKDGEPVAQKVTDFIELDDFIEHKDQTHHDRYAQQSHELSNDASEATSRALIRVVPLVYGALLGGLANSILLGLLAGLMFSMAFDLKMGEKSMTRVLLRGLCHAIAKVAYLLERLICLLGLAAPAALRDMHCRRRWL